jgi:hypothetical protein
MWPRTIAPHDTVPDRVATTEPTSQRSAITDLWPHIIFQRGLMPCATGAASGGGWRHASGRAKPIGCGYRNYVSCCALYNHARGSRIR